MLSLIVLVLILGVLVANYPRRAGDALHRPVSDDHPDRHGERFWTLEAEDGVGASFKTLLSTLAIAATISLVLSIKAVARWLFVYPETLGLIMAAQLLIGRYTGYRLMELLRFRDFLAPPPPGGPWGKPLPQSTGLRLVTVEK